MGNTSRKQTFQTRYTPDQSISARPPNPTAHPPPWHNNVNAQHRYPIQSTSIAADQLPDEKKYLSVPISSNTTQTLPDVNIHSTIASDKLAIGSRQDIPVNTMLLSDYPAVAESRDRIVTSNHEDKLVTSSAIDRLVTYKFDLKGFPEKDIRVQVANRMLSVTAAKKKSAICGKSGMDYCKAKRNFEKHVTIPKDVIASKLHKSLGPDGVLTVTFPIGEGHDKVSTTISEPVSDTHKPSSRLQHVIPVDHPMQQGPWMDVGRSLQLNYDLSKYQFPHAQLDVSSNILTIRALSIPGLCRSDFNRSFSLPAWVDPYRTTAMIFENGTFKVQSPGK